MANKIEIKNKKAYFEYIMLEKYTAGIVLTGTEIKSIRTGKVSLAEAFCQFNNGELFVKNMHISEYTYGTYNNHEPKRERKLLLTSRELRKLQNKMKDVGLTIVPLLLFFSDNGLAKLEIALAKGKKLYDKRETIKDRDSKRSLDRMKKH